MASDLSDLYQEILLEHNRRPRNFRTLEDATHHADGFNPLCGDEISLQLRVDEETVGDVGFQGHGCAISRASASLLTQAVKGASTSDALAMFDEFHRMLTEPDAELDYDLLGDLEMLAGVIAYPTRIKCAILAWHTLKAAMDGEGVATTE
ncbi:MAG: SUF system NifU family Fe-S cluster assembly protein [Chloroflexota bacterium]|nr:SUF system NifU family Fe-S cluster assembly protein [Chloroflexota bacterium]MDE2960804.1 SUF system NifU family Fe-S cluster assembly protein [Chloroflexota bacterium]